MLHLNESEGQGCEGRSAGLLSRVSPPLTTPWGANESFMQIYDSSAQQRELYSFEARNLVILAAKTAGILSPPILLFLFTLIFLFFWKLLKSSGIFRIVSKFVCRVICELAPQFALGCKLRRESTGGEDLELFPCVFLGDNSHYAARWMKGRDVKGTRGKD